MTRPINRRAVLAGALSFAALPLPGHAQEAEWIQLGRRLVCYAQEIDVLHVGLHRGLFIIAAGSRSRDMPFPGLIRAIVKIEIEYRRARVGGPAALAFYGRCARPRT